jgi:prepilin-type N-terminal cleavage/methylation domain-containing protein
MVHIAECKWLCNDHRQREMDECARPHVFRPHHRHHVLSRRVGFTLVELLVALVLAAVVLGTATISALRQQRTHIRIRATIDADGQTRAATQVLAGELSMLDPAAGDLVQGEASDTALQIRAPIANSIACQQETGSATFLPDVAGVVPLGGQVSLPRTGDTLWWLSGNGWLAARIASVGTTTVSCINPVTASGQTLHIVLSTSQDTISTGAPLRVTRQTRYALYRAGNGTWQLGLREWNDSTQHFPAPQPIVGELLLASAGRRSGLRYFTNGGVELTTASGPIDVSTVARIRLTALSILAVHERLQDSVRTDSVDVALLHAVGP